MIQLLQDKSISDREKLDIHNNEKEINTLSIQESENLKQNIKEFYRLKADYDVELSKYNRFLN